MSTTPLLGLTKPFNKPLREVGSFIALSLDTFVQLLHPPFFWRECISQCWFVARVATFPAIAQAVAFNGMVVFLFGVAAVSFGAGDITGAASGLATVSNIGPVTTVFVLSGAAATAMCADLGSRTIREEIDAMRVLGLDPIHRSSSPGCSATTSVAVFLSSCCDRLVLRPTSSSRSTSNTAPGAFAASLTLITGLSDVLVSFVKASLFGFVAGLIACYKGFHGGRRSAGVGNAVNETVCHVLVAVRRQCHRHSAPRFEVTK